MPVSSVAGTVCWRWFGPRLEQLASGVADKDAKTRLQEYLQGRGNPLPEYELLGVTGDDHDQLFSVALSPQQAAAAGRRQRQESPQGGAGSRPERTAELGSP